MTYAIIETGGKQLRVEPGRFYDIELLSAQEEEKVTIEKVLLVQHNGEISIGQPLVAGAKVEGTVMRHLRGRKVLVYKMKPKKKTRKKRGHRQEITRLMINSISLDGLLLASEPSAIAELEEGVVDTTAVAVTIAEPQFATLDTTEPDATAELEEGVVDTTAVAAEITEPLEGVVDTTEPDATAESLEAVADTTEPDATAQAEAVEPDATAQAPEAVVDTTEPDAAAEPLPDHPPAETAE